MRPVRTLVSVLLVLLGLAVAVAAVVADPDTGVVPQILMVLTGLLLVEAAGWKRSNPFLPSTRRHDELREEVGEFLDLVRHLNAAGRRARRTGSPADAATCRSVAEAMHRSVDRMHRVAGRIRPGPPSLAVSRGEVLRDAG